MLRRSALLHAGGRRATDLSHVTESTTIAPLDLPDIEPAESQKVDHIPTARIYSVGVDSSWYTAGIMHELPLIVFQIDYSKCPIQLPAVPPAHHLPMRVLAQMRHRKLGETGGHGHSNLHLEPTLASWHPRMARPRALAQASVERPRDEAPPATSWRPAGASQLLPPATLLHSIGLLRQA